ncbi:cytochrome c oxidase subunit V [Perkinsela sp. CCAP 1560/4]|nr:cytochrome c oxidase subunit V [Perkinsela sp. CCAP 1560/4]|eukprot:KNH07639.1 cytochrome c oxidase subunit V [Perkinsela sp. CCAP 1560/4]
MKRLIDPAPRLLHNRIVSSGKRYFFGKGWDNASLEIVFRGILRRQHINAALKSHIVSTIDQRTLENIKTKSIEMQEKKIPAGVFLSSDLGDPHRVLKAYSLTAYPILDESGKQSTMEIMARDLPLFADPDDDYSKVVMPHLDLVKLLAREILKTLNWEVSPKGAASFLESLYRNSEMPDSLFETPKILDTIDVLAKECNLEAKHN